MRSRSILFAFSLIVLAPFETHADSAVQTDWSEGNGILGPVLDWGSKFYQFSGIDWSDNPGILLISQSSLEHTVNDYYENVGSIHATDIDGDGDCDVIGADGTNHDIAWWENVDGSGTSWTKHFVDDSFWSVGSIYSEDINSDGDMDVIGTGYDEVVWWENDDGSGTSWTEHTIEAYFEGVYWLYSEDINGDGYMDVLAAAESDGYIIWWENSDTAPGVYWTKHTVSDGNYYMSIHSEDIDGDGDMDVLSGAREVNDITWYENNDGSGTSWTEHIVDGFFNLPYCVYSEDMNGDGDMDVLAAGGGGYNITWWENDDGSGTSWIEHTVDMEFTTTKSVYAEDIDGDNDMDILGTSSFLDDIAWWENTDGSGTSWLKHTLDKNFNGASSVYSEDFNGDGSMDVLGAAPLATNIIWWDITGYLPEGSLESSILNTECSPQWASIDWNSSEPAGTDLYFQYRTSNDFGNMGIWSDPIYEPCFLSGLVDQYFQYRVLMETDDPYSTPPTLHDLTLSWDPYGIEGDPYTSEYSLLGVIPNPTCGVVSICFGIPELALVRLSIFDLTGRLISENNGDEYSPGFHEVLLGDLSPGIYFCRMISGVFAATQSFVVIE